MERRAGKSRAGGDVMPKASLAKSESLYGVHPGVKMVQKSLAELQEKTGRSLRRVDCVGKQ
jgi:hypothetical protein